METAQQQPEEEGEGEKTQSKRGKMERGERRGKTGLFEARRPAVH